MTEDIVEVDGEPVTPALLAAAQELSAQDSGHDEWEKHHESVKRDYLRCARDAVEKYLAAIRETHAMVPREPSVEMIEAGYAKMRHGSSPTNLYTAMIAAAEGEA